MDFFQSQEHARRHTVLLIVYYCLAVLATIVAVYVAAVFAFSISSEDGARWVGLPLSYYWNPRLFLIISSITVSIVTVGTVYKILSLLEGGAAVARLLGGRLVNTSTTDPNERKLLNVVEEMAIASGSQVPPVYLLDEEQSINAFAAGFSPNDAVIGVTRGCVEQLTRDELQGVIAHEFSHIFNGDMRMNIKMMGVLHGILVIGLIGYTILRITPSERRGNSREKGGVGASIMLFGLLTMVIGYIGVFFGKLIKAAVSRQREFLADASAVQFTRNPEGLGGALKKIGGIGGRLRTPRAEEASHFYFAEGVSGALERIFATHPPLAERIKRIDSSFDARELAEDGAVAVGASGTLGLVGKGRTYSADKSEILSRVGDPTTAHLSKAEALIQSIPSELRRMTNESFGAQALVFSLLLAQQEQIRTRQLEYLKQAVNPLTFEEVKKAERPLVSLRTSELRLPLVDLAIPALKGLSKPQYSNFRQAVFALIKADKRVTLFEFVLARIVTHSLDPWFTGKRKVSIKYADLGKLIGPCQILFSALALNSSEERKTAAETYAKAMTELKLDKPPALLPQEEVSLEQLNHSLNELSKAAPRVKKQILSASVAAIEADGKVSIEEAELIRAVAESLDCPLPLFL